MLKAESMRILLSTDLIAETLTYFFHSYGLIPNLTFTARPVVGGAFGLLALPK